MNEKNNMLATVPAQAVGFNYFDSVQFNTMQRVCALYATSELVPEIYKYTPAAVAANATEAQKAATKATNDAARNKAIANCMIAIEMSMRIGASPLMVMQNMALIYGKPSWSSKFLIATVNTCGRFAPLKFRFTDKGMMGVVDYVEYIYNPSTRKKENVARQFDGRRIMDVECIAYTTAKGSTDILEGTAVSLRLAVEEGWYTKNGSKWRTMPRLMLMYRAASFWVNGYAPEISMGMRTVEENEDIYTDVEEITTEQQVAAEKAENANRITLGIDPAAVEGAVGGMVVDTATGEIMENKEGQHDEPGKDPENAPGF